MEFKKMIQGMKEKEEAEEQKPYKTIGELEHYIRPYGEWAKAISGNPKANFTIFSKKVGQNFDLGSPSGLDFETEEEAKRTIDEWEKNRKPKPMEAPKAKPKRTVGEDLSDMYAKAFFEQSGGDRDTYIEHNIRRFGIPKGSTRKREIEFYGKQFDEMEAKDRKPQAEEKLNAVRGQFPKFIEDLKSTYKEKGDMRFDEDAISDNIYRMGKGLEDDEIDLLTKELSKALEKEGFENETKYRMRIK